MIFRHASPPEVIVIGLGRPDRGDDAVGLLIARQIMSTLQGPSADALPVTVSVLEHDGDGAALVDMWRGADAVILVDAVGSGAAPGVIHRLDVSREPLPGAFRRDSTHALGALEAVELARALGWLPRRVIVYGVEAKGVAVGAALSREAAAAAPVVAAAVIREVRMMCAGMEARKG
jgi:hydrogenase maturation protease